MRGKSGWENMSDESKPSVILLIISENNVESDGSKQASSTSGGHMFPKSSLF